MEKNIINFIKQTPCIPATKGVRVASVGSFLLFLPIASLGIIVPMLYDSEKETYIIFELIVICALSIPIVLQKYYANRLSSKDKTASTYWLIGTLFSLVIAADATFICFGFSLTKSKEVLLLLIIVSITAAIMTFLISLYWCKRRIIHYNGKLDFSKKVIDYPAFITPIIMLLISYTSSSVQVSVIAFIISLESAILVTGLAQTWLKLKLAKKISAEKYLPIYKP